MSDVPLWEKRAREAEANAFQRAYQQAFDDGVQSVMSIRCIEHRAIPPWNANEITGAECGACAYEKGFAAALVRETEATDG
jgi:hypothetical protein